MKIADVMLIAAPIIAFAASGCNKAPAPAQPSAAQADYHGLREPGDSPVLVAGGSTHFIDYGGWSPINASASCVGDTNGKADTCSYGSRSQVTVSPMYPIQLVNVKDASGKATSLPVSVNGPWKIEIHAAKDADASEDPNHGVVLCSAPQNTATCDSDQSPSSSPWVTLKSRDSAKYGFYWEADTTFLDKRYHNEDAHTANCPHGRCEDMTTISIKVNGTPVSGSPFKCYTSVECKVILGKPLP
jgi:hypothetical protein